MSLLKEAVRTPKDIVVRMNELMDNDCKPCTKNMTDKNGNKSARVCKACKIGIELKRLGAEYTEARRKQKTDFK